MAIKYLKKSPKTSSTDDTKTAKIVQGLLNDLEKSVAFIKKHTNLPVVPGFGIKNSTDVNNICKIADGAVVGSSIIKIIEENLTNKQKMLSEIDKFSKDLKNGTIV